MSKTYDRVEWKFLKAIMLKLGFDRDFVDLIFRCISSVSYSIRVNHSIYGKLIPQRGLCQGDPLSSYLFAICAQGLSTILTKAENDKWFQGVKIAYNCPLISHLFVVGDSLIFFRALASDCDNIKRCLQLYEKASDQIVNYDKSYAITFSPSAFVGTVKAIKNIFFIDVVKGQRNTCKSVLQAIPTYAMSCFKLAISLCNELEQLCANLVEFKIN